MSGTLNLKKWLSNQAINIPTKTGYGILFIDSDNKIKVKTDDGIITEYGRSAYDIWLDLGNTGTNQDFIDSLKGDTGSTGTQGIQGESIQGIQGIQGLPGADGAGLAPGGTTGQIIVKASNTDFDTEWIDLPQQGINIFESDTPPSDPILNPLWLDTSTAKLKVYFTAVGNFIDAVPTIKGDKGNQGDSNVYAILSNPTTSFTADNNGIVSSYASGATELYVFEGNTELVYNAAPSILNGQWKFNSAIGTNINWSGAAVIGNHNYMAPPNSMTADNAYITYEIEVKNSSGITSIFNIVQNFSKSKQGNVGNTGATGATGQGLIAGGLSGQILAKNSNTDFDTIWIDAPTGGGGAVDSLTLNDVLVKPTPIIDKVILTGVNQGNIIKPSYVDQIGNLRILQSSFIDNNVTSIIPTPNSTALIASGTTILTATGKATATGTTLVSSYTQYPKMEYLVTNAATTAVAGGRQTVNNYNLSNNSSSSIGYTFVMEGGQSTGCTVANKRFFMGLSTNTGNPTDVDPGTLTNIIGIYYSQNTTNLSIIHNGTGASTSINTGIPKPTTDRSVIYQLIISNTYGEITFAVKNLITGQVFNYTIPSVTAVNCPINAMISFRLWSSVGGTSSIVGTNFMKLYTEQQYISLL